MENNELFKEINIKIESQEYADIVHHPRDESNYENIAEVEASNSNVHEIQMPAPIEEFDVKNEPIEFNEKQMWSPIRETTSSGVEIVRIPADENEIEIKDEPFDMEDVKGDTQSLPINEYEFQCDLCIKRFKSYAGLRRHERIKHEENRFKCDICDQQFPNLDFNTKRALATHKGKVHKIKAFQCDKCSRGFSLKQHLSRHKKIGRCKIKKCPCPVCNVRFMHKQSLVRHMKKKHAGDRDDCLDEPKAKVARIVTPNANVVVKEEGISMGNAPIDTEILPTEARNTSG